MRKSHWERKALDAARVALSLGKSLTTRNAKGFFYPPSPVAGVFQGLPAGVPVAIATAVAAIVAVSLQG